MRKRIHKRTLSLLLAVALLVPIVPTVPSANAAETDTARNDTVSTEELSTEVVTLDEAAVPDIIGAADARERNHVRRRYDEEGDNLNTVVFQNADGSRTMYMYDFPVKYVDENGDIQDISLDIADLPGGKGGFRSEGSHAVTTFSPELDSGIILADSDRALRLVPERPLQTQRFDMTADYSARRVDEKTVEYTYDEYTTLEYSLTYTGFKEDIVVSQYTGQTEYTFTLYTNGLTLTQIDGSYFLTDEAGEIQATIGDIIVFTADERNNTFGQLLSSTIVENEEYLLTIVLDADYLSDPKTVYPIRIDPTIDLNYDNYGSDAIEDVTINSNAGSMGSSGSIFVGLRETKGIARTLMRFPDLPISTMAGATITSATVEIRDLMCETTSLTVECYPFKGSSWTEDSTWATISSQSLGSKLSSKTIKYSTGASLETIHRYSFNITAAVQDWVDGDVALSKGIIFKATSSVENGSTYNYRTFASFNRASYKPSLSVTYNLGISLDYSTIDVDENQSFTLTATTIPAGQTVTWSSSNTTVATVSSTGKISARKAGKTTITAKLSDGTQDACTVYVTLADGIYYIENVGAGCYLGISEDLESGTSAHLQTKDTSSTGRLVQLWKVKYVSDGKYIVRPMTWQKSGLYMDGADVNITGINIADSFSAVPTQARWQIYYTASGYSILNNSSTSAMLMAQGTTNGSNVGVAGMATSSSTYFWRFERAYGVFLYDKATMYPTTSSTKVYLELGESATISNLNLAPQTYGTVTSQSWSSSNTSVATVNSSGKVTSVGRGESIITVSALIYGTTYTHQYLICSVYPVNVDVQYDNAYLSRYSNAVSRISVQMNTLSDVFLERFNVHLNYGSAVKFTSYADENCYTGINAECDHGVMCNNADIYDDGSFYLPEYHHKNVYNILLRTYSSATASSLKISYIGHNVCRQNGVLHVVNNATEGKGVWGLAYDSLGILSVTDTRSERAELATLVHEFGHLFGAPDHYGSGCPSTAELNAQYGTELFNMSCIYGERKDDASVVNGQVMCAGCLEQISQYIDNLIANDQEVEQ